MRLPHPNEFPFTPSEVGKTRQTVWIPVQSAPHSADRVSPRPATSEQIMAPFRLEDSLLIYPNKSYVPICRNKWIGGLRVVRAGVLGSFLIAFPLPLQSSEFGPVQLQDGLVATPFVQEFCEGRILFREILAANRAVYVPSVQ